MRRAGIVLALAVMLSGCAWFKKEDPAAKPAELTDFTPTASIQRLWSTGVGKGGDEIARNLVPAVDGEAVYAADREGRVRALGAEDGRRRWVVETGIRASAGPGVGEGLLVLGGLEGEVVALSASSGEERWRARVSSEVLSVPAISGSRVVVRCIDGRVFGFDRVSGVRQWVSDHSVPLLSLRGTGDPVIRAGAVIMGLDNGKVTALNLDDGSTIWEQTVTAASGRTEIERMVDVDGHISVVATDVYAASFQGNLMAMALDSGRPMWSREISSWQGVSVRRTQLFLVDDKSHVWAFDRRNGASLWKQEALENRRLTTPVVVGQYVAAGDFDGYLHVFAGETGELAARTRVGGSPIDVAPTVRGNVVYALTRDGDLGAFRIQSRQ